MNNLSQQWCKKKRAYNYVGSVFGTRTSCVDRSTTDEQEPYNLANVCIFVYVFFTLYYAAEEEKKLYSQNYTLLINKGKQHWWLVIWIFDFDHTRRILKLHVYHLIKTFLNCQKKWCACFSLSLSCLRFNVVAVIDSIKYFSWNDWKRKEIFVFKS